MIGAKWRSFPCELTECFEILTRMIDKTIRKMYLPPDFIVGSFAERQSQMAHAIFWRRFLAVATELVGFHPHNFLSLCFPGLTRLAISIEEGGKYQ